MVPWSCSAPFRLPVETWRALMAAYYPGGGWVRLETGTLDRLAARKAAGGLPELRRHDRGAAAMTTSSGSSTRSCGRATRSTRTRRARPRTRRRRRSGSSTRPRTRAGAAPRTTACGWSACSTARRAVGGTRALPGRRRERRSTCRSPARSRSTSAASRAARGWSVDGGRMALWVVNETEVPEGLDRAAALRHSLLSTHLLARADGGRFISPLEARGLRAGQHLARARQRRRRRRARRRDHAPRPPAARAREPRQPVRLDRDRGGAAAARDGAVRRGARADGAPTPP